MNGRERVINALWLKNTDRMPVTGFMTAVTTQLMERCGFSWLEAHYDAEKLVKLAAAAHEYCGFDTLKLPFDMAVEAEALGGEIYIGTADTLPQLRSPLYEEPEDFAFTKDLLKKGRIPLVLKAISMAAAEYDAAVVSSIVGPFTLGTRLFGMENFLIWLSSEPEKVSRAMERLTDLCVMYATEQVNAGTDVVQIGEAASSGDLISSDAYRDYIAPYHKRLCGSISVPTVVHICGNITGHLPYIPETGMTGISFDIKTDAKRAAELLKGKCALIGFVDTMDVLLNGTPELVYSRSVECINAGVDLLSAGCALPAGVSIENLLAMVKAVVPTRW